MGYGADLRRAWNMLWNPGKESKVSMDIGKALKFYYEIGVLGMVLYWIVGALLIGAGLTIGSSYLPMLPYRPLISYIVFPLLVFSGIFYFLILIPIGIAINAFLYHIVGKYLLNAWNGNYSRTLAAVTFSEMPMVLFFWLVLIPFVRILVAIFAFWQAIILIIALAAQQKTSRIDAFVAVLATLVLAVMFAFMLMAFAVPYFLPYHLYHISSVGYPV
ncbi:MAG: hypothetical protein ACP5IK_02990 [Candidatus Micrarchaeia archaeon]